MDTTTLDVIEAMPGPAARFTGRVEMQSLPRGEDPSRVRVARVTFHPGARTAWHSHPFGQMLIVTDGEGWARIEGEDKVTLRPGTVLRFPANIRHWHGAAPGTAMTHIAIQEADDTGETTDWQEHVTDVDYMA